MTIKESKRILKEQLLDPKALYRAPERGPKACLEADCHVSLVPHPKVPIKCLYICLPYIPFQKKNSVFGGHKTSQVSEKMSKLSKFGASKFI